MACLNTFEANAHASSVRFNGLKNPLPIERVAVLPHEDGTAFGGLTAGWVRDLAPNSEAERMFVRQVAIIAWKLERAERYEMAVLSRRVIEAVDACESNDDNLAVLRQAAAMACFDPSNDAERLRKYQFALMRELRQMIDALAKLRKQVIASNEPKTAETHDTAEHAAIVDPEISSEKDAGLFGRHGEPQPATSDNRRSTEPLATRFPSDQQVSEDQERDIKPAAETPATNEPIAYVPNHSPCGRKRDRWPLKAFKKQQRHAERLKKSMVAKLPADNRHE